MPQFDSGAAEPIGRFSEGLLLRLLQLEKLGRRKANALIFCNLQRFTLGKCVGGVMLATRFLTFPPPTRRRDHFAKSYPRTLRE